MKKVVKVFEILIYLVGIFFVLMAFGCFNSEIYSSMNIPAWLKQAICFLIQCIPGVIIVLLNYLLRKKHFVLGLLFIAVAIFFYVFFDLYKDFTETWIVILIIIVPLLAAGIVFLLDGYKKYSQS